MTFEELQLAPAILEAVREQGYSAPTPIQQQAIPLVLDGCDLLAGAQTGTGKTASFMLPMLQLLSQREAKRPGAIRALVLAPTRELAAQVQESAQNYGRHLQLTSAVIFGGVAEYLSQNTSLSPVQVLHAGEVIPYFCISHYSAIHTNLSNVNQNLFNL
ncbi:MAG: DEAD/DEAH box helicase, partial [Ottowia sp.]|nr:DEAD/DEAH box helicase [Ottowia sp.]